MEYIPWQLLLPIVVFAVVELWDIWRRWRGR